MKTWIKLYTGINRDPDMGSLTWAERGIWSALLALAGEIDDQDEDGPTGILDTVARIAWHLRCDRAELECALASFVDRGMVELDGIVTLCNFGKRQSRAPSSQPERVAERVQRHRDKAKRGCNEDVTTLKQGVTLSDSDTEEIQKRIEADAEAEADVTTAAAAISESPESLASYVYTTIDEGMGWKLAPNALEEIGALIDDYPEREWWDYALRECAISQTRNLRYLDKCLATAQSAAQPVKPVTIREKRAGPPAEWARVLETMYSTQTRASVDMWLGSATVEVIDKTLIIGPSTGNARDWIENRMAASITDAVGQALGDDWGWKLEEVDDGTGDG